MTVQNLFNIAWKSICVLILYMVLSYLIGIFVENKEDISLWRQGTKDAMGVIIGVFMFFSLIIISIMELDNS